MNDYFRPGDRVRVEYSKENWDGRTGTYLGPTIRYDGTLEIDQGQVEFDEPWPGGNSATYCRNFSIRYLRLEQYMIDELPV